MNSPGAAPERQHIIPHLWFTHDARAAAEFYTSVFPGGRITGVSHYPLAGLPGFLQHMAGKELNFEFEILGCRFMGLNGGEVPFSPNPAVAFFVICDSADEVDSLWKQLSRGGRELMPLGTYPFSPRCGWVQDRFGISWQLTAHMGAEQPEQRVVPALMFTGANTGRAEEAMSFYSGVFPASRPASDIVRYSPDNAPEDGMVGLVMSAGFTLAGQRLMAMDSGRQHGFTFTEAVSFLVSCRDQQEIDAHWTALSADPASERCGWLKDRYGLSWQIVPASLGELLRGDDGQVDGEAFAAFLNMKKIELAAF